MIIEYFLKKVHVQIFEEMKVFCVFKGVSDDQIEVSDLFYYFFKNFNQFGQIYFIFIFIMTTFLLRAKMSASCKIWNGLQILLNAKIWPHNEELRGHSCV